MCWTHLCAVAACKQKPDRYDLTHLLQAIACERRSYPCLSWMSPKTLASARTMSSLSTRGVGSADRGVWKTLRILRPEPRSTPNVVDQGSASCYADLTPSYRRAENEGRGRPPASPSNLREYFSVFVSRSLQHNVLKTLRTLLERFNHVVTWKENVVCPHVRL